jgi:hypothetical protein
VVRQHLDGDVIVRIHFELKLQNYPKLRTNGCCTASALPAEKGLEHAHDASTEGSSNGLPPAC